MNLRVRWLGLFVVAALGATACSSAGGPTVAGSREVATVEPTITVEPTSLPTETPVPTPTATATPAPTPEPSPTSLPTPTPTPEPSPTSLPTPTPTPVDTSPVVVAGDGWAITEAEVQRMHDFIEQEHELEFTSPVRIEVDDDIGAGFAAGIELLPADEWRLYVALGLIPADFDREAISEFRRDRIRGVCCPGEDDDLAVIVEPRETELETQVIVVHELVHALHRQHPELWGRPGPSGGFEQPDPHNAVIEAIPQLIAFRWLDEAPPDQQAVVAAELPIVKPDVVAFVGEVPAAILNFNYFAVTPMAQAVYDEFGAEGLSEMLRRPPTTTEQVIFPDAWIDEEDRVSQSPPPQPADSQLIEEGRLGVVVLEWMIGQPGVVDSGIRDLLSRWTGDRYALYSLAGRDCVAAVIEMDDDDASLEIAGLLTAHIGTAVVIDDDGRVRFDTCSIG